MKEEHSLVCALLMTSYFALFTSFSRSVCLCYLLIVLFFREYCGKLKQSRSSVSPTRMLAAYANIQGLHRVRYPLEKVKHARKKLHRK
jgi:hypothetical protein